MDITIRKYSKSDAQALLVLYHDAVHRSNAKDYSADQINAWVPSATEGIDVWKERFANEKTLLAESDGVIIGLGNLHGKSIGMLYVATEYQKKGVGAALLKKLEKKLKKRDVVNASAEVSITARPFFENQGYRRIRDNRKIINGQELFNYIMEKKLLGKKVKVKKKSRAKGRAFKGIKWVKKFFDLF